MQTQNYADDLELVSFDDLSVGCHVDVARNGRKGRKSWEREREREMGTKGNERQLKLSVSDITLNN